MTKLNIYSEPNHKMMSALRDGESDAPIGIVTLWRLMRANKFMLALPALLFGLLASFLSLQAANSYSAEAQMILTRGNLDIIELESSDRKTVDNAVVSYAVNILNSRALAQQVVEHLDLVNNPEINPYLSMDAVENAPGLIRRILYATVLSPPSESDAASLDETQQEYVLSWLHEAYTAQSIPNSNVIIVRARSHDSMLSADIANVAIETFLTFSLDASQQEAEQAIAALSSRVQSLRLQLQTDQSTLQDAQANIQFPTPEALQSLTLGLFELRSQDQDLAREITILTTAQDVLKNLSGESAEYISKALTADPRIRKQARVVLSADPVAQTAKDDLAIVSGDVNATLVIRQQQYEVLTNSRARLEHQLQESNKNTGALIRLEVELETTTAVYASALERLKELVLEQGLRNKGGRFLARAVQPVNADRQGRRRFVLIAMILGLLVGATIILVREAANERIRNLGDVSGGMNFFGRVEIPRLRTRLRFSRALRNDKLLLGKDTGFSEAVRVCRRLIGGHHTSTVPQVISVISALPGEGKSTLSGALARSFVLIGKRTLLIDADMRARGLTKEVLSSLPKTGLQQAILNHQETDHDYIKLLPDLRVDFMPAGLDMRNPADLLEMAQFCNLIKDMQKVYDVIIIDTPPILLFPDALSVIEVSTDTLMVAGYNQTQKSALKEVFALFNPDTLSRMTVALCKTPGTTGARFGVPKQKTAY